MHFIFRTDSLTGDPRQLILNNKLRHPDAPIDIDSELIQEAREATITGGVNNEFNAIVVAQPAVYRLTLLTSGKDAEDNFRFSALDVVNQHNLMCAPADKWDFSWCYYLEDGDELTADYPAVIEDAALRYNRDFWYQKNRANIQREMELWWQEQIRKNFVTDAASQSDIDAAIEGSF